ncbi:transglycosylase domain-containing protein [Mangrovimonas sp. AS39]|uniref:transglycosylase domain-containing protein n=1 Tax=Mangrovimonas futianensis TaxID=2895523 RepID=UPI001E37962F|nr:transglycosylase domain-containing protein [Mangrovimonas futianensis]MCF1195138.1 transglycosylase domain-containing protein [Mangrovimonas futianensis]
MNKKTRANKKKWLSKLLKIIGALALFSLLFFLSIYVGLWGSLPSKKDLKNFKQAEASIVFDHNQKILGKYFVFDRQIVKYEDLPKYLVDGLVATEDARFYDHHGIDYTSFFRVAFKSILMQDASSGGGSTITQQLAKNLFGRKSYGPFSMPVNKIKEMITASRIEEVYSKAEIIELYLNTVPFSENTFGIESASQKFFNTNTQNLSLSEAATLVGTLKANHSYNPRLFPERSQLRRDVVLQQMEKYGYIDEIKRQEVSNQPLEIDYHKFSYNEGLGSYFREHVRLEAEAILDSIKNENGSSYNLYTDGLKITTTLDNGMQTYAERATDKHMGKLQQQFEASYGNSAPWIMDEKLLNQLVKNLPKYKELQKKGLSESQILDSLKRKERKSLFTLEGDTIMEVSTIDSLKHYLKFLNAGFVALDPHTGAVRAYVGGINFEHFKYDHVSMGKRQVGSTFKPIVYTAAIENGMDPCTYFSIKEVTYTDQEGWTPSNASKDENDPHMNYSLEKALSHSVNTIAVKVLDEVGILPVVQLAENMGITSKLPEVPSLALGTAELSLLELSTAYTGFANANVSVKPYFINKIEDRSGTVLYEYRPDASLQPAYSDRTRETMIEFMKSTVNEGTARRLRSTYGLKNDIAGKTGTTQDNKDGWFVGITPHLIMASWVGNDHHQIGFKTTAIGQGANSALPIVANFLVELNNDRDYRTYTLAQFNAPSKEVLESLDCNPEKRDGFFKRLFGKKKKEKEFGK